MADILPDQLDVVADDNTTVPDGSGGTIDIAENCAAGNLNNAVRSIAAAIAALWGGMYSGTSRPTAVRSNSMWRDTTSGNALKFYDGTNDTGLPVTEISDTGGNEAIKVVATASAVNEITVTNAATAGSPEISATGSDTNIDLTLNGKGTGLPSAPSGIKVGGDTITEIAETADITAATAGKVIDAAVIREAVRAALNTQQTHYSAANSYGPGTETELTDLATSITPSSASANVMIEGTITMETGQNSVLVIKRGGVEIGSAPAAGSRNVGHVPIPFDTDQTTTPGIVSFKYRDNPASASAVSYTFFVRTATSTTTHVNRSGLDTDANSSERGTSTIILSEC